MVRRSNPVQLKIRYRSYGSVGVLYDLNYKDFAPAKRVARALEVRTPSRRGRGSNPDSAETRGA